MGAWTLLEAVNHVLENGGEAPVSSLSNDSASVVSIVMRKIKAERLKILSKGHEFNTTYPYMAYDINGNIHIGNEILSIDGWQENSATRYTVKNGLLYDSTNETNIFTENIHLCIIADVDFDEIRTQLQYQIMASVAKTFQRQYQQDQLVDAELVDDEQEAHVVAAEEELRNNNIEPKDNTPMGRLLNRGIFGYD